MFCDSRSPAYTTGQKFALFLMLSLIRRIIPCETQPFKRFYTENRENGFSPDKNLPGQLNFSMPW